VSTARKAGFAVLATANVQGGGGILRFSTRSEGGEQVDAFLPVQGIEGFTLQLVQFSGGTSIQYVGDAAVPLSWKTR